MHANTSRPSKGIRPFLRRWHRLGCLIFSIPCAFVGVFVLFVSVLSPPMQTPAAPRPLPDSFMKGVSYVSWWTGEYASSASDQTLSEVVVPSGANWIAVIVKCYQETVSSTNIECRTDRETATDDELRYVIRRAHGLGLKVMLKPHVELSEMVDATSGRFAINFGGDAASWRTWFDSYARFISHYAALAQELGVEYFVVGTELGGTVIHGDEWRAIIRDVRAVYDGPLTYAALTWVETLEIDWWGELDTIGIDAYFPLSLTNRPTLAQMKLGWTLHLAFLDWLARRWHKPIIVTEVGYLSVDGTNVIPGDWSHQARIDVQEQADAYQSLFEAFAGRDWWQGVFWWAISTNPNEGGANDRGYSFHNKPAEAVVRQFYGGEP
jgi:hypothetical protein